MTRQHTGRVLIAGIGNVFLGDDGFGVEVVRRLRRVALPDRVDLSDYGIRGLHLAYDLLDGRHPTLVMVDAVPLDQPPGTLAVLEVDADDPGAAAAAPGPGRGRARHGPGGGAAPAAQPRRPAGPGPGRGLPAGCDRAATDVREPAGA